MAIKEEVDWNKFDISVNGDDDVSKSTCINEFRKYNGTSSQFVKELAQRFEYSGMMCVIIEDWLND